VGLVELPVDRIEPNPSQPRHSFAEADLAELAASISQYGVLQPVLVSATADGRYRLVAGERRWRAARMAGLSTVPAIVRERLDEDSDLELALVENLQRRDLTPLEEARAFEQLRVGLGLSQAEIAGRVGIDRSTVANALRLLKLPADIQAMVEDGSLSGGHARALLAFASDDERRSWAKRAVEAGLSVRDLEREAVRGRTPQAGSRRRRAAQDPNLLVAEERLSLHLGAKVEIRSRRRGGIIVISCPDQTELMRVFDRLMGGS
jgi:ParB family chromosome partitioning protein